MEPHKTEETDIQSGADMLVGKRLREILSEARKAARA